jgi:NADH:ubiquinone oxidoreductase subunit F (NADH-binding)
MEPDNIILKLKENNLLGRSGGGFPVWQKWEQVLNEPADKKYVICNGAEGEPGVFKDGFILENYPNEVLEGMKIALETIDNSSGYIYLRKDYYKKFKKPLEKLAKKLPITVFKKRGGYLAGEETVLINDIEGKRLEPRIKPPFPTKAGLFNYPTLVNNVETFYCVAKIAKNTYRNTRFYSISGDVKNEGVYELPLSYTISQVLKETGNWPKFDFFVQEGGAAAGEILLSSETNKPAGGIKAIVVYNRKKTDPLILMKKWINFFAKENCDKCVPCREGTFRIMKILEKIKLSQLTEKGNLEQLEDLFFVLKETSFCPLGRGVPLGFESLIKKIIKTQNGIK